MQWLMLQQEEPEDFVIASGRMKSVRDFIEIAAKILKWNTKDSEKGILWEGEGVNEVGRRADTKEIVIKVDARYYRPTEVEELLGDFTKAKQKLGWEPKTTLEQLVEEMIKIDKIEAQKDLRDQKLICEE